MSIALTHSKPAVLAAVAVTVVLAVSAQASRTALPFHGTFTGQLSVLLPFSEGSADRCNANATAAGEFPGFFLTLVDAAEGEFTHLGRVVVESTSCLAPDSPLNVQGEAVFHAADASRLFLTFDNVTSPTSDPDRLDVVGTESIVDGTGRFAGASGTHDCRFSVRLSTLTIEGGCRGTIAFE